MAMAQRQLLLPPLPLHYAAVAHVDAAASRVVVVRLELQVVVDDDWKESAMVLCCYAHRRFI